MRRYPAVVDEVETMQAVCSGASIARYGDGELKMCRHAASLKSQVHDRALQLRLRAILRSPGPCLIGVPNLGRKGPKHAHWSKHAPYAEYMSDSVQYHSAFMTRPDSAPWIDTPEYWSMVESLWVDQDVTVVRGSTKSFTAEDMPGAGDITEIIAPRQHAWSEYKSILDRVGTPRRALICLGPTATVMAFDLCARGVHAIDCGHLGMFYRKHMRGEPMWVTKEDKARVA